jgi:FecR protein
MRAYVLLGGTLCAIILSVVAMVFEWPRPGTDLSIPIDERRQRMEFGRGVLATVRSPRPVVIPGQAVRILLGTHSILDTSVSAFTRGVARDGHSDLVASARLIGNAQFDVALDSRRWYTVRVGDVRVATTGARFKIRLDLGQPATTSVAVEEGVVALQSVVRRTDSSRSPADSAQIYDLSAGNVAWWSESLPPTVVRSVDVRRYRQRTDTERYAPAVGDSSDRR